MPAVHYQFDGFPPKDLDWERLGRLIGPATAALARYDGRLSAIPNPRVLLSPLVTREAVASSRIEGTVATVDDVLGYEAGEEPESEAVGLDVQEVINYRSAMQHAEEMLLELPLSLRVVRGVHKVLMSGVRGETRTPGEFRTGPVHIGPIGSTVEQATYLPATIDQLMPAWDRLEKFMHDPSIDRLIQTALVHVEFEAIHPFNDGNGRLGRILIPIFLWWRGLISTPMFYISSYIDEHRDEYIQRLRAVSADGDWTGWCTWFMEGVRVQAEENLSKANTILALYESMKERILKATQSKNALPALDFVFRVPAFTSTTFTRETGIPQASSIRILKSLVDADILFRRRSGSGRRPSIYWFPDLTRAAEGLDPL